MRKHLFVAATAMGFGEALLGVQLATALHAAGDRVLFLGPSGLQKTIRAAPVRYGRIDLALSRLDEAILDTARSEGCDSIVLIDLVAVYTFFGISGRRFDTFLQSGIPVLALDVWNVPEAGLHWDYHPETFQLGPDVKQVLHRLVPVPFVRPTAAGAYNALPPPITLEPAERAQVRQALGVSPGERLIFWPSAAWQHASQQLHPVRQRMADALPELICTYLSHYLANPKGATPLRVLHIGPEPFAAAAGLGDRYRHLPQQPASEFLRLLAASDLLLSFNIAATTVMAALAAQVPVLIGSLADVSRAPASAAAQTFVARAGGLYPFRAWPLSLSQLLAPVLQGNPYVDAIAGVDVLDEAGFLATLDELLGEAGAALQRQRQALYTAQVRALPSPSERFYAALAAAQQHAS